MINMFNVNMMEDVDKFLSPVLQSGYIGQGPRVEDFEFALKPWLGNEHIVTVNSGTSALQLACRLAGATYGKNVISTPMTCSATNEAILATGAEVIWADINPTTGLIDPKDVFRQVNKDTVAIMAVDWGGLPCDYDELKKFGLPVISDAAHATGGWYKDRRIGNAADYTAFSFQAIKHLTTGDGGALTCLSPDDYKKAKLLRWYGLDRESKADFRCEQDIVDWGYKFHMNDISATIGLANLRGLERTLQVHKEIAGIYHRELKELSGITLSGIPDRVNYEVRSSFWLFTILLKNYELREAFKSFMARRGIAVSQVHRRNDEFSCFASSRRELMGTDYFSQRMICIPIHAGMTHADAYHVVDAIARFA